MITQKTVAVENISETNVLELLKEYGIVVIPNYLNNESIGSLLGEFENLLTTSDTGFKSQIPYSNGRGAKVFRRKMKENDYPVTAQVFGDSFMNELKNAYLGSNSTLNSEIFVVNDVVGTKHHANDLHFDIKPTLKFFLYLTDTNVENGAFTCVPGSHKVTKKIRAKYGEKISYENREFSRELPPSEVAKAIPIEGNAGTLIIFHTDTFHKAGVVSRGERKVMRGHCRLKKDNSVSKKIFNKIAQIFKSNG
ncbi:MAG: phytanoyl-CoA dioxygenase family protein [Chitinophagales bacterium]